MSKFDICSLIRATTLAKNYVQITIEQASKFLTDPDKNNRKEEQQCIYCFYFGARMSVSLMKYPECAICTQEIRYLGSDHDKLCSICAKTHKLCRHCGADINLKNRRKL